MGILEQQLAGYKDEELSKELERLARSALDSVRPLIHFLGEADRALCVAAIAAAEAVDVEAYALAAAAVHDRAAALAPTVDALESDARLACLAWTGGDTSITEAEADAELTAARSAALIYDILRTVSAAVSVARPTGRAGHDRRTAARLDALLAKIVVTYMSARQQHIDICEDCANERVPGDAESKPWPRDVFGEEYATVSRGAHLGTCGLCQLDAESAS